MNERCGIGWPWLETSKVKLMRITKLTDRWNSQKNTKAEKTPEQQVAKHVWGSSTQIGTNWQQGHRTEKVSYPCTKLEMWMGKAPEGIPHEVGRRITTLCRIDIFLNERQREKDIT